MSSMSVGFDAGSKWSKVGIIEDSPGQFRLIYKMRSIVAFDRDMSEVPIFGQDALKADANKIIADANRDHKFASKYGQVTSSINETVPFRCYANYDRENGNYHLALNNTSQTYAVSQQKAVAAILAHLMAQVKKQFKACQEYHAVITVPSFASDNHRRVILEAAQLAGCFTSVQLLNQTTAALLAYNFDRHQAQRSGQKQTNVGDQQQLFGLICFGAGSFECSLFHPFDVNNSSFSPDLVETGGTSAFGSSSFTDRLAQWCLAQIDPDDGNYLGMNARKQIWEKCEEAKQELSKSIRTTIHLLYPSENGLKSIEINIKRAEFECLCQPLLAKLGQFLERTFGPNRGKIGRLQLAGEGWRMPAFMKMVEPYLAKNCVKVEGSNHVTAPGDWVVKGAAIEACVMKKCRLEGNEYPFEDLLYRRVNLAASSVLSDVDEDIELRFLIKLFKPGMQISTDKLNRNHFECTEDSMKILLEEDGLQMAQFTLIKNAEDGFNKVAFHIDLNGLLQARLFNSHGAHKELVDLLACLSNWSNLYGNGLDLLREELTNLSILPRARANAKSNRVEEEKVEGEDKNAPNVGKKMAEPNANANSNDRVEKEEQVEGEDRNAPNVGKKMAEPNANANSNDRVEKEEQVEGEDRNAPNVDRPGGSNSYEELAAKVDRVAKENAELKKKQEEQAKKIEEQEEQLRHRNRHSPPSDSGQGLPQNVYHQHIDNRQQNLHVHVHTNLFGRICIGFGLFVFGFSFVVGAPIVVPLTLGAAPLALGAAQLLLGGTGTPPALP